MNNQMKTFKIEEHTPYANLNDEKKSIVKISVRLAISAATIAAGALFGSISGLLIGGGFAAFQIKSLLKAIGKKASINSESYNNFVEKYPNNDFDSSHYSKFELNDGKGDRRI